MSSSPRETSVTTSTPPSTSSHSSSSSPVSHSKLVSPLLKHLHRSLSEIDRLYIHQERKQSSKSHSGLVLSLAGLQASNYPRGEVLPPDPQTREEGETIVDFFCRELDMGPEALRAWREGVVHKMYQKWVYREGREKSLEPQRTAGGGSSGLSFSSLGSPSSKLFLEHVARRVPLDVWEQARHEEMERSKRNLTVKVDSLETNKEKGEEASKSQKLAQMKRDRLYFYPRPQDTGFVHSCIRDLKAIISPFLTLSPPPRTTPRLREERKSSATPCATSLVAPHEERHRIPFTDTTAEDDRPFSYDTCSTFYATQFIPAGMCLMCVPTAAGFFMNPQLSSTPAGTPLSSTTSFATFPSEEVAVSLSSGTTLRPGGKGILEVDRPTRNAGDNSLEVAAGVEEGDPYAFYFQQLEDLVAQLCFTADPPSNSISISPVPSSVEKKEAFLWEESESGTPHTMPTPSRTSVSASSCHTVPSSSPLAGYLSYLKESVVPCKNLPFIRTREELWRRLGSYALEVEEDVEEKGMEKKYQQEETKDFYHTAKQKNGVEKREQKTTTPVEVPRLSSSKEEKSHSERRCITTLTTTTTSTSSPCTPHAITRKEQREAFENSAAYGLWSYFHETLKGEPLSPLLRQYFGLPSLDDHTLPSSTPSPSSALRVYHWWLSVVLSRRLGSFCLMPLVDKLNHSPLPNCYYTMASPVPVMEGDGLLEGGRPTSSSGTSTSGEALRESMTGLDVFHNLLAGVPSIYAYEPYFHVFALRDIHPGEALTLCYQAPTHQLYRPAHTLSMTSVMEEAQRVGPTTTVALLARANALRLRHPGKSCVHTLEGQGSWQLQWGFAPSEDSFFSAQDLMEMGILFTEKRIEERKLLFPVLNSP